MNKEEARAGGYFIHEMKHSMKRRSPWHDYHAKGLYMLTLVVSGRQPLLGRLQERDGEPYVERTPLGTCIECQEVAKIGHYYPMVEVWRLCIMPDHLHMILRVKEELPKGKSLGNVVKGFKTGCSRAWWHLCDAAQATVAAVMGAACTKGEAMGKGACTKGEALGTGASVVASVPSVFPEVSAAVAPEVSAAGMRPVLFEPGYNDKILLHEGQLDAWKHYLDDNPRRLWLKRQHRDLFTVLYNRQVAGRSCQIVGNRFLLDIPDKVAVIVHRRYTDEENARLRDEWLNCGERGGVLVSAAIAPKEKEVLREAMNRGYRIILLRENGFPPLYKPSGESFDACSAGLLLQISPWEYHMQRKTITREQCLELNGIAESIAGTTS